MVALIYEIGAPDILSSLLAIRGWYLPAASLLLFADSILRALNWRRLLKTRGFDIKLALVVHSYLYGGVVGGFIPSSLGSDVARTALLARRTSLSIAELASSIVVLNATGLWALCVIALVQTVWFMQAGSAIPVLPWALAVSALGVAGIAVGFEAAPYAFRFPLRGPKAVRMGLAALRSIASFAQERPALTMVAAVAVICFGTQFVMVFLLAKALHLHLSLQLIALLLPIVLLSRLIPLSIAGFGAEQGVFVLVFGMVGISAPDAFALSVAASATRLFFWALCGVAYFIGSATALRVASFDSLAAATRSRT